MKTIEQKISEQLRAARTAHQSISNEQKWIIHHLDDERLQRLVPQLSISGLHILTALLAGESTGVELAQKLQVTRGGVTRAAKKMVDCDLMTRLKHPDDQKKIYYSLTKDGHTIALVHQQMHQELNRRFTAEISQRYTPDQLQLFSRMLADMQKIEDELIRWFQSNKSKLNIHYCVKLSTLNTGVGSFLITVMLKEEICCRWWRVQLLIFTDP